MGAFAIGVGSGVIAAFVGFILKEWATSMVRGFRVRKLLATDMKETIRGLSGHYPSLGTMETNFTANNFSFIWDSSSQSQEPEYVTNAIFALTPLETTQCWRFYGALSRLDAIRDQYNASVLGFITEESKREPFRSMATACLHDLQRHYADAISVGSSALLEIKKNHRFIEIDVGQCDADVRKFGNKK